MPHVRALAGPLRLGHSPDLSDPGPRSIPRRPLEAFTAIGGVPTRHIRYDNLTSVVTAVLHGRNRRRTENQRWIMFRSHYGFDAFYCQPGSSGAHEKGGVEGEVGRFRRNRLTPMPEGDSLDELNDRIRSWETDDNDRRIGDRVRTVGDDFAAVRPLLHPLPTEPFDPGLMLTPRADRSSLIHPAPSQSRRLPTPEMAGRIRFRRQRQR